MKNQDGRPLLKVRSIGIVLLASLFGCGDGGDASRDGGQDPDGVSAITDVDNDADGVLEGAPIGNTVGLTLSATAPDPNDTVTYSLVDDAEGRFRIDATTGIVSLAKVVDFEAQPSHEISVRADSSDSSWSAAQFSVSVFDNKAPVITILFPQDGSFSGAELTARGTVSDAEGESTTVTLTTSEGQVTAVVESDGTWTAPGVTFGENLNPTIVAGAVDAAGEVAEDVVVNILRSELMIAPRRVELDFANQVTYVVDNGRLLKVDIVDNEVTIVSGPGVGAGPSLGGAIALTLDLSENLAYVLDFSQDRVCSVNLTTGDRVIVTGDGVGTGTALNLPFDLLMDSDNSRLYILDRGIVYAADLVTGNRTVISNVADYPDQGYGGRAMVLNAAEDTIYYVGSLAGGGQILNTKVSKVDIATGVVTLLADDSLGAGADFERVEDIVLDESNGQLLIVDSDALSVVAVDIATGDRSVYSGPGVGTGPSMQAPFGLFFDATTATTYLVDLVEDGLMAIDASGNRSLLVTSSVGEGPHMDRPETAVIDVVSQRLFVTTRHAVGQTSSAGELFAVDLATGARSIVSGAGVGAGPAIELPKYLSYDGNATVYITDTDLQAIVAVDIATGDRRIVSSASVGTGASFVSPGGIVVSASGDKLLMLAGSSALLEIDPTTGDRTEIAGPNTSSLSLSVPRNMILDAPSNRVLVSDSGSNAGVFAIDLTTGTQTTIADDSVGAGSNFQTAVDLSLDESTNTIYLLDVSGKAVYSVSANTGDRSRLSGNNDGVGHKFLSPNGLVYNPLTQSILVSDISHGGIVAVDAKTGDRLIVSK